VPLKARVGRHTKAGQRHCQNWVADQTTVIGLLNQIAMSDGGAEGMLDGRIRGRMVAGMASDALYAAISRFEDMYFPGQRSGYVDPGGRMLKRMEELANRAAASAWPDPAPSAPDPDPAPYVPITSLDIMRRNLLDFGKLKLFSESERKGIQPLIDMAVAHVDRLKTELGLSRLPFDVELFGRAWLTKLSLTSVEKDGSVSFVFDPGEGRQSLPLPEMKYGQPVDYNLYITTGKLGALLLYEWGGGECCMIPPYHTGAIRHLGPPLMIDPQEVMGRP
jgi:hypothetical protein